MQFDLFEHESIQVIDGDTQVCKICSKEKHISLFPKHIQFKSKIDNRCKACIKKQSKLRNELKKKWQHLKTENCDCCGQKHHKSLVIDHDHNTLKFRGWICEDCNLGIGKLGDDIAGIEKALSYMKRHYDEQH